MTHFGVYDLIQAKLNRTYGIWVVAKTALDTDRTYNTPLGTLEFIPFSGWNIVNFKGYNNIPAQDKILLPTFIGHCGVRKYHFYCKFDKLLRKNKFRHPLFKMFGLPRAYTE